MGIQAIKWERVSCADILSWADMAYDGTSTLVMVSNNPRALGNVSTDSGASRSEINLHPGLDIVYSSGEFQSWYVLGMYVLPDSSHPDSSHL